MGFHFSPYTYTGRMENGFLGVGDWSWERATQQSLQIQISNLTLTLTLTNDQ
jgi:hypothetical protein